MGIDMIRKRDGREVPFDQDKIEQAIFASFQASGSARGHETSHKLTEEVVRLLENNENISAIPSVEQVQDTVEQVLASFLRIYDELCLREVRLYPGIDETVRRLHEAGYHLLVVTNKPQQQADKIVRHFFGDTLFEGVYGGGSAYPKKPDPTSAQLALRQVNADPAASWFVGDSDVDVLTAKAAHLRCVGAAWGFRGEAELRRAGADAVAMTAADILPCILADRRA